MAAAVFSASRGIESLGLLTSGFGLTTSAAALIASAAAPDAAVLKLGAGGALRNAAGVGGKAVGHFSAKGASACRIEGRLALLRGLSLGV